MDEVIEMRNLPSDALLRDGVDGAFEFRGAYRAARRARVGLRMQFWLMGGVYVVFWFAFRGVRPK